MGDPIPHAPPPWTCKISATYIIPFYHSASNPFPKDIAYDPLEAKTASFSSEDEAGKHAGGLCFAEVVRYSDTPVGPYDELLFLANFAGAGPYKAEKKKSLRITGIWVSSRETCMNGRRNWGIPKHMARFTFTTTASGTRIQVFHSDPTPSPTPFFTTVIKPIAYTPTFPFSTSWLPYLGLPTQMIQPPNPAGEPADIIVATDSWIRTQSVLTSRRTKLCWVDMLQPGSSEEGEEGEDGGEMDAVAKKVVREKHWWPGMKRWIVGMACVDAVLEVGVPEVRKA